MTDRDAALRGLLVDAVHRDAAPRRRRTTVLVAVIAFAVGGGVVGGALSAGAAANPTPVPVTTSPGDAFVELLDGGQAAGPMVAFRGPGATRIDLGPEPRGATGMAVLIRCGDVFGRFDVRYGGKAVPTQFCGGGTRTMGFSTPRGETPADGLVRLDPESSFPYTIWAEWITVPPAPQPSAAQLAATADGVVTRQELDDAIGRYLACMTGAGFPQRLVSADEADGDIEFEATAPSVGPPLGSVRSLAQERCMTTELGDVDAIWQRQLGH
jgi:hypothetical protein